MEPKINYALVGLFVIVLGAAWIGISMWLALGDIRTNYDIYYVFMGESVAGLYVDAPVKYRGVEVGKVREIALNPDNLEQVRLALGIESGVPIKTDTVAVLSVQGLTGIAFIDLTGGSRDAPVPVAVPGEKYPVLQTRPSLFARLDVAGSKLLANLNQLTMGTGKLLDQRTRNSIHDILDNISTITATLADRQAELDSSLRDVSRLLAQGADASERLPSLLDHIDHSAASIEKMALAAADASNRIGDAVTSGGSGLSQFSEQTLPQLGRLLDELHVLADTILRISRKLEEDPRVILYGRELESAGPGE